MKAADHQAIYRPSARVLAQAVHDEMVLLDLNAQEYFALNAVGRLVWEGIQAGDALADIIDRIQGRFEVTREQLEHDVETLLKELLERGVLLTTDSS